MRVGMNPLREERLPMRLPPEIPVVAVTVHLPDMTSDYHRDRWEVVTASLRLARQNAGTEHHFVVWDNGSCDRMREWLFYEFKPDKLMFTANIGVLNTMRRVFGMYQDSVIAYGNDDILYYPDWLPEQLQILQAFPNVGTVSGCVTRLYSGKADENTVRWARENKVNIYQWLPPAEWDFQHAASIGTTSEAVKGYRHAIIPVIEYNGVRAGVGGNHCQIVFNAERLLPFLKKTDRYMEPLFNLLDVEIDRAGLLRLLTITRRTRHLGNRLTDADRKEINDMVEPVNA